MKRLPTYHTPDNFICPACHKSAKIIALDSSFSYAGTHCTGGRSGIHYPSDYGMPITDCCEVEVPEAEIIEPDYDY